MTSLFSPPKPPPLPEPPPPPPPPAPLADTASPLAMAQRKRKIASGVTSGRQSTILSDAGERLGG